MNNVKEDLIGFAAWISKCFILTSIIGLSLFYITGGFNDPKDVELAAKKWTIEKRINAPIIECYKDYYCDVAYDKNNQIYAIKLSCTKEKCRLD